MARTLRDLLRNDTDLWAAALQVVLLAAVLVPGSVPWAGPVLLVLTETHGVHASDLLVVLLGLLVVAAAAQRGLLVVATAARRGAVGEAVGRLAAASVRPLTPALSPR